MKQPGSRKLWATALAMVLVTLGYAGTLYITHISKIDPANFAANYLTFVGAIAGALTVFVGSNAAVHIKGKEPQA